MRTATTYIPTGVRTAAAARTAQDTRRCMTCGKNTIKPGVRHLETIEYPGAYAGYADTAGHPVRAAECAICAHRCGRGDILDPTGRETIAVLTLGIVEDFADDLGPRWQADPEPGETLTDAAERRIRELADEAEQNTRNGYVLLEVLGASHLYDDYQRIKAGTQALAFEQATNATEGGER